MPALIDAHTVEVNGLRFHYLIAGEGSPLVLLHGWPQHSHQWRRVMPALAEHHTVVAPHLRGAGGVRGALGWYRAVFETASQIQEHAKTKLRMPVLGMNGEFGQPDVVGQMKLLAEDVRGGAIQGSGHFVAEEKPEELRTELFALFARAGDPAIQHPASGTAVR